MKFKLISLFPEMLESILSVSIIGRAVKDGKLEIEYIQLRDYSENKHKKVDDYPYGGGPGMLLKPEPVYNALVQNRSQSSKVIYMSPKGRNLTQSIVKSLAEEEEIIILAGHYEGLDQRIIDNYIDESISIGEYVLTGGELPAAVLVDSIARLLPGVLSGEESFTSESHYDLLLEHPQYTRPQEFMGYKVPDILLSGNHAEIEKWRRFKSIEHTIIYRPDLIDGRDELMEEYNKLKKYFSK